MRIKEALYVGGIASGFSLVLGLFSGNPFLTVLIKAIVGGGGIAAIFVVAFFLMEKFLPEIVSDVSSDNEVSGAEDESLASSVNIVVDDSVEEVKPTYDLNIEASQSNNDMSDFEDDVSKMEDVPALQENLDGEDVSVSDELQTIAAVRDVQDSVVDSDTSSLPDVDSLEDDFFSDNDSDDDNVEMESDTVVSYSAASPNKSSDSDDPELMAKAIRTLLKKEEEGT
ncbi:hypothetical protein WKV44_08810 [Spirochaetia bacterium 38H-sp]|uniref:Uncharacterized protein n=1 Tax=Rarispira pelagica TaxID=3141764 RepID=A0ABU9UD95_9SPIR